MHVFSSGVFFCCASLDLICCLMCAMELFYHVVCCCMDCQLSLGLGHAMCIVGCVVAWIVTSCLMCVMDCDLLLDVCHGLCIMVSCCVVAWIVMLFA